MTGRLGRAALALGLAQFIGCAQGYDYGVDEEPPTAGGFSAGLGPIGAGATSQAGTPSMSGRSGGAGMMYTGDPCERGQTEECTCEGGQGKGIRMCRKDDLSPTMGSFSACEACVPDEEDPAGMGGSGSGSQSGSGAAGRAGAGGSSSSSAGSGSTSAGRSGTGGTSGRSGSSGGSDDPAWCFFVPIPLPGICD